MKPLFKMMTRVLVHTSPSENVPLSFAKTFSRGDRSSLSSFSSLRGSNSIIAFQLLRPMLRTPLSYPNVAAKSRSCAPLHMARGAAPTALLGDVLHPALGYVFPAPQPRKAILAKHVGWFTHAIPRRPNRNQMIVLLANELVASIAGPPAFR